MRPRNKMSLGDLLNNIYSMAHRLEKTDTRNSYAGNVNDIQHLGTHRAALVDEYVNISMRLPSVRIIGYGDQLTG